MAFPYEALGDLGTFIDKPDYAALDKAACKGLPVQAFHPDKGEPERQHLELCDSCPGRLMCLALALRAEETDLRFGWFGGLGPSDRDDVADALDLPEVVRDTSHPQDDRIAEAARLRATGSTVREIAAQLGCSRRTVQRYLKTAA